MRYCADLGGWHVWTGTHWKLDKLGSCREYVKSYADKLFQQAVALQDADVFRSAKRAGSASGVRALLELLSSEPGIAFEEPDADADGWLLNCQNGSVDLRTGELRPHDREDLLTRCTGIDFDPNADAPLFKEFLSQVQPSEQVRAFLARLFGYSGNGVVQEHIMPFLYGPGANGKSVFASTIGHVLGDYAHPGPPTLISYSGTHEPHPTDVASCVKRRLVILHETQRGAKFNASKVKALTGGDKLSARFMRADHFEFDPTHTMICLSNYKPQGDGSDAALWRRILLVPFHVTIPEEEQDKQLTEKLRAEAPGILRWLVDGHRDWHARGLQVPPSIRQQTAEYRASEDIVGRFIKERCAVGPGYKVQGGKLYEAFKRWCLSQGEDPVRGREFSEELKGRGYSKKRTAAGMVYSGIGLHADESDQESYYVN
jgi:putative DNA primase/helicase